MIALCIYLWACSAFACLIAIYTVRPPHTGDLIGAVLFPILLPIILFNHILKNIHWDSSK